MSPDALAAQIMIAHYAEDETLLNELLNADPAEAFHALIGLGGALAETLWGTPDGARDSFVLIATAADLDSSDQAIE
ncbi:hypothetical protein [Micromonospora arida]